MSIFGRWVAVVAIIVVLAACGAGGQSPQLVDSQVAGGTTYTFAIPLGTGLRVDRGEAVNVIPDSLKVHVGESISIVNHDDRGHNAGPFYVGAGQTLTQRFTRAGTISGACSVHLSGTFVLEVDP